MPSRLVSILGLGPSAEPPHYTPVAYQVEGAPAAAVTPLVQRALLDLNPDIGSVVLLGTAAVKSRWVDSGLARKILGRDFGFTLLPDGATSEARWQVFNKVARALRADAIDDLEDDEPDAIVFDVTHGFRLQPMLGLAALAFVRSDEARDGFRPTPVRVTYGAFEARDATTNIAPIWDLTELMVAAEWNAAFDAFIRYGRADDFPVAGSNRWIAGWARSWRIMTMKASTATPSTSVGRRRARRRWSWSRSRRAGRRARKGAWRSCCSSAPGTCERRDLETRRGRADAYTRECSVEVKARLYWRQRPRPCAAGTTSEIVEHTCVARRPRLIWIGPTFDQELRDRAIVAPDSRQQQRLLAFDRSGVVPCVEPRAHLKRHLP